MCAALSMNRIQRARAGCPRPGRTAPSACRSCGSSRRTRSGRERRARSSRRSIRRFPPKRRSKERRRAHQELARNPVTVATEDRSPDTGWCRRSPPLCAPRSNSTHMFIRMCRIPPCRKPAVIRRHHWPCDIRWPRYLAPKSTSVCAVEIERHRLRGRRACMWSTVAIYKAGVDQHDHHGGEIARAGSVRPTRRRGCAGPRRFGPTVKLAIRTDLVVRGDEGPAVRAHAAFIHCLQL